ncbi:hypothetical protein F5051DRAFT_445587 [Lentinula edodes]|nr:hypothetical protein F5051DRAFT_445587 [Lentinula edodes]
MCEDSYEEHPAQLILIYAHKAGPDEFLHWITCDPVRQRLERVFIDEAHKIVIDSDFLSCFKRFPNLAPPSVPITFLSGSLMLRSMPVILEAMEINDAAVVDEIYRCSGRRNLKYVVERTVQEGYLENILQLVQRENERAGSGFPVYTGDRNNTTQALGQGVAHSSVRAVIHKDSQQLINWYQEAGRAGPDGLPALCPQLPFPLRKIPRLLTMSFDSTWSFSFEFWLVYEWRWLRSIERHILTLTPYSLSDADVSRFSKKLVADIPHNPKAGEEQLTELNNILESVVLNGCLDCWVKGGFHADGTMYNRFWDFTSTVVALKGICTGPSAFWPFCYDCWDPFRWACNRLPSIPKKPHGPGRHIHRVAEEASGEFAPDILIALIFTYKDSLQRSELITGSRGLAKVLQCVSAHYVHGSKTVSIPTALSYRVAEGLSLAPAKKPKTDTGMVSSTSPSSETPSDAGAMLLTPPTSSLKDGGIDGDNGDLEVDCGLDDGDEHEDDGGVEEMMRTAPSPVVGPSHTLLSHVLPSSHSFSMPTACSWATRPPPCFSKPYI